MKIKLNDVYRFRYNETYLEKIFMPYHCFDGQLVVKEKNGELYLEDTYWGFKYDSNNKKFTLEEALLKGSLEFVCNLGDVEKACYDDSNYYDSEYLYNLSYQNGCYQKYCKKKDISKSKEVMEDALKREIKKAETQIEWHTRNIKRCEEKLQEVENGNLDIYI